MDPIIREILDKMTLKEKAALCSGADFWHTVSFKHLKLNSLRMSDGPHGLRKATDNEPSEPEQDKSLPATCFPTASALAASWNPDMIERIAGAIAEECREENVDLLLGPGINIKRSPLCGRNFEYFSEDPFLTSVLAEHFIKGVQSSGVGAIVKHFAANQQEYRRMVTDSLIDMRALREIYLYAFEKVIKNARPWGVMSSYNKLNGTYASENKFLLTTLLRDEWGFDGVVMSDWGAVNDIVYSIAAGLNLEMPSSGGINPERIVYAVKNKKLSIEKLDKAVSDIIRLIIKANRGKSVLYMHDMFANHVLAKEAAEECIVLLKNQDNLLPLGQNEKIALVGEMAVKPRYQGVGSSKVNTISVLTAKEEMSYFNAQLTYSRGYDLCSDQVDIELQNEAISIAEEADKVVIFAGLPESWEAEGMDRASMDLPISHTLLIRKIAKVNPNTIVVLSNGAPVAMPWIDEVKGVVEGYLTGQASAGAMAGILFGERSPSGKLAETFPLTLKDTPTYSTFPGGPKIVPYKESIYVGYRYYQKAHRDVLFPFGYGLSYTSFAYSNLRISSDSVDKDAYLSVTFDIENTGDFPGKEICQLYIRHLDPPIFKPLTELKGFDKIFLYPSEKKSVTLDLEYNDFAFYDVKIGDWNVLDGDYQIYIGASSEDIRLTASVHVNGTTDYRPQFHGKEIISYESLPNRTLSIPDLEFKRIYGREFPENQPAKEGQFNLETTIGEIKYTKYGKWVYRYILRQQMKRADTKKAKREPQTDKSGCADSMLKARIARIESMPIRSLVLFSGGKFDYTAARALLMILNGKEGGLKKLREAYLARKKINKTHR